MKVAIGQFGAPTTVINSSLFGVLRTLETESIDIYGVVGGVTGLVSDDIVTIKDAASMRWLRTTPGAALRAGRYADYEGSVEQSVDTLARRGIDKLIVLGGNGTMGFGKAIQSVARAKGYPLSVVGIPKTIDNDIVGIDYSPGFPSAARFVIQAVRDLQLDLEAMVGFEQVRIVEVMGRRCGWLTASAAIVSHLGAEGESLSCARNEIKMSPPIICLPERPLVVSSLLKDIEARVKTDGSIMVVVSEGVRDAGGNQILQVGKESRRSAQSMLGGVGAVLAEAVREKLGYGTRYENLGLLQRCWSDSGLASDRDQAERLGVFAAKAVIDGHSGVMAGLIRPNLHRYEFVETLIPLENVADRDRLMTEPELSLEDAFLDWLSPLIEMDSIRQHRRLNMNNIKFRGDDA